MDSGSLTSEHEADSGVGSMNSFEPPVCISITVPDLGIQVFIKYYNSTISSEFNHNFSYFIYLFELFLC